jgi:hypothetical protein
MEAIHAAHKEGLQNTVIDARAVWSKKGRTGLLRLDQQGESDRRGEDEVEQAEEIRQNKAKWGIQPPK